MRFDAEFRMRRGFQEEWANRNTVLGPGEQGFEIDKGRFKIGDGKTPWAQLKYFVPEGETSSDSLNAHIINPTPHPAYDDDIPSLSIIFENGLI